MRYQNPARTQTQAQAETASSGEGRELLRLLLTVAALIIGIMFLLDRAAWWLAPKIPFAWEASVASTLKLDTLPISVAAGGDHQRSPRTDAIEAALQQRVDRIVATLGAPADMTIRAHYVESPVVNAVATLGGHVSIFSGLLERLEYTEELDAVLAHEIGHVMHRHMVQHLSRGITTAVTLELIGVRSASLTRWLIGDAHQLQQLAYSREAEREADKTAHLASHTLYGHTNGMVSLFARFQALQEEKGGALNEILPFLQSHPLPESRMEAASRSPADTSHLTPLLELFRNTKKSVQQQ